MARVAPTAGLQSLSTIGGKRTGSFWVSNAGKLPFVQAGEEVGLAPNAVVPRCAAGTHNRTFF